MTYRNNKGFTLIELMIVVVVIAIFAAIAIPAYQSYVERARRADAKSTILAIQLAQEKWRANNPAYSSDMTDLGYTQTDNNSSIDGFYIVDIAAGANATNYTVTAQPTGPQVNDVCGTLTLTVTAANGEVYTATGGDAATCWQR
ncbi:type IV pilin protein [Methylophaga sp. OBS3]|uniref:type IV pilin protein n=1 Tax=Methylophaga sp. OBS3 TaxID=2991934 RepID=UPI002B1CB8F6|nr:type IV pilin protein [Methylophaga sp. OBS3]